MPADLGYQLLVTGEAFDGWMAFSQADRLMLADTFEFLANYPFTTGDYEEVNGDGFTVNAFLKGRFLIAFRADHAARELRIIRVERA